MGMDFINRYKARFGANSSPLTGAQVYDSCQYYALGAAIAGGSGGPGDYEQNRKVADRIRALKYRGVMGMTNFDHDNAALPYPDATKDPSLGMPHQYLQIQDYTKDPAMIAPPPYETASFVLPPWFK